MKGAKEIIRAIDNNHNDYHVLLSGGKDSLCVLDLVYKNLKSDFDVVYIEVPGNTHPLCTEYTHRIVEDYYGLNLIHLKAEKDEFFDLLRKYGYPSGIWYGSRWCLNRFKNIPLKNFGKLKDSVAFSGQKISDSSNRKRYITEGFENGIKENNGKWTIWGKITVLPIVYFSKSDVWNYIKRNNLPLNPCYSMFNNSANCLICPFNTFSMMKRIKANAPEFFNKWKEAHKHIREDVDKLGRPHHSIWYVYNRFERYYRFFTEQLTFENMWF